MPRAIQRAEGQTALQCMELRGGSGVVDESLRLPGIDVWVVSRPFAESRVGGDVHYVSTCGTGRIARVLLADISGHGPAVKDLSQHLHDLMARHINVLDQRKLFRTLNQRLSDIVQGGSFATAVILTFFAPTNTLSVSNAGHPPPLIWRSRDKAWSQLMQTPAEEAKHKTSSMRNLPLGVIDVSRYDQFNVTLDEKDLVLCFTDCVTESRDATGELLSSEGLLNVARAIDGDEPATIIPAFLRALQQLSPENLTQDDLTMLAFRANGGAKRVTAREHLSLPAMAAKVLWRRLKHPGPKSAIPWPDLNLANVGGLFFGRFNRYWRSDGRSDQTRQ